jgi:uncharacterized membrane protein
MGKHTPDAALRRRLHRAEHTVASLKDELAALNAKVDEAVLVIQDRDTAQDAQAAAAVAAVTQKLHDALVAVADVEESPADPPAPAPVEAPGPIQPSNWPLQS